MKYINFLFFLVMIISLLFVDHANAQSSVNSDYNKENIDNIQDDSNFNALLRMTVSLLIVLSLIIGSVFLLKKFRIYKLLIPNAKNPISIISNISLGSKRSLCLIKVANEILIIGITNSNISLLSKMNADDYYSAMIPNTNDNDRLTNNKRDFPSILKSVMERFRVKTE